MQDSRDTKCSQKEERIQCNTCKGTGWVKREVEVCDQCNGIKCMYCNSSGYKAMPHDTCDTCCGEGEVDKE